VATLGESAAYERQAETSRSCMSAPKASRNKRPQLISIMTTQDSLPCELIIFAAHIERDSRREASAPEVELASVISSSNIERGVCSPISAARKSRPICSYVMSVMSPTL
jgi:hypothetical protein